VGVMASPAPAPQAMEAQQQASDQRAEEQRQAMEAQQQATEELREMVRLLADAKA
jgi:hypothetical protein